MEQSDQSETNSTTTPTREQDPEIKAISAVLRTLGKLPDDASRERVVAYCAARFRARQVQNGASEHGGLFDD